MAFISGSKGKGSRRFPGRDGGRRRGHPEDWSKQARHATQSTADLMPPLVTLRYQGEWLAPASKNIYRFDQLVAKIGAFYYPRYRNRLEGFDITVAKSHEDDIRKIIDMLEPGRK